MDTEKHEIISINVTISDNIEDVLGLVAYYDLKFPILLDYEGAVSELYGLKSIPLNIIIGSDGIIMESILGGLDEEQIIEKLEQGYQN